MKLNPKSPPIEQRITPSQLDPAPKNNIYQLKLQGYLLLGKERATLPTRLGYNFAAPAP